ncbi:MAG: Nif3-like dinuclear metal center hexameric protein [Ignavibacteriales bacterium]|nr:MAG: Nif3-like dinuclear metal center hexameric protein [Ignavibacteriales bacterium]
MKSKDVIEDIEEWTPKEIAWQKDNVGLQVGSLEQEIKNIMLCLDVDENVIAEAGKKNCNLIISHHPFLFYPIKKINTASDQKSKLVSTLLKKDISVYSMHTNFDYTKDGVSFKLAEALKLQNIRFLKNFDNNQLKLVTFVPKDSLNKVANAMFNAGAGIIGEYSSCSFLSSGTGTFKGSIKSNPAIGKKNFLEQVDEQRLEVVLDSWKLTGVIKALKSSHPYEEPAYDVYPILNGNVNYGAGAVGELSSPMNQKAFLDHVSKSLRIKNFRYSGKVTGYINKIGVCGGSGTEYISDAVSAGCDAFVTADIKYHTFQEMEKKILLIDAGHYETEIPSLKEIEKRLNRKLTGKQIKVYKYSGSTNPVIFYNKKGA